MKTLIFESTKQYYKLNRILESVNISLLEMLELAKPIEKAIKDSGLEVPEEFKSISKIDLKNTDTPDNLIASLDNKTEIKIGRLLTQFFPQLKPNEITKIVAKIKVNLLGNNSSDEYKFKLYNNDIGGWYKKCFAGSCMTKDDTKHLPYTYDKMNTNGEHNVSILILYKNDKPFGRALVWYNVKGANKGIFMDRVYPSGDMNSHIHDMFHKYANNKGWAYRENSRETGHEKIYNGTKHLEIDLNNVSNNIDIFNMPFMDTFNVKQGYVFSNNMKIRIPIVPDNFIPSNDRTYLDDTVKIYNMRVSSRQFEYIISDTEHSFHWLSKCIFKNASIIIDDNNEITISKCIWISGKFMVGYFENSTWKGGVWGNGEFNNSIWEKGNWDLGKFTNSIWKNGTWNGGYFIDSTWNDGTWKRGNFENSTWKNGSWEEGTFYKHSIWKNGIWEFGEFSNSIWEKGTWKRGDFNKSTWESGTWEQGGFSNSIWKDGTWIDGDFNKSTWKDGTWEKGYFYDNSIWENGIFIKGWFHESTWKNGVLNGVDGFFDNSIWNNGIWKHGRWIIDIETKYNRKIDFTGLNNNNIDFVFRNNLFKTYKLSEILKSSILLEKVKDILTQNNNMYIYLGSYKLTLDEIIQRIKELS